MQVRLFTRIMTSATVAAALAGPAMPGSGRPAAIAASPADVVDTYLSRLAKFGFSGSVLIARDGGIVLERGYGLADRVRRRPFTKDTVVDIGSVTKTLTRVAILQLADRKLLRLDDALSAFFDRAPADKAGITVRQLLNHTSGIGLYIAPDPELLSKEEFLRKVFAAPLVTAPGTEEQYSNPGYTLLAAIVEQRSGTSFERYLREHIFEPAGMRVTGYALPRWADGQLARNYRDDEERPSTFDYPHPPDGPSWTLRGNGGLLSTVGDMYRFHLALQQGQLLPPGAPMFAPGQPFSVAGSDGVHYFVYTYEPAQKLTLIASSTDAGWRATEISGRIVALLNGEVVSMPPDVTAVAPTTMARYAGLQRLASGAEFSIEAREGRLIVTGLNEAGVRLLAGEAAGAGAAAAARADRARTIMTAAGAADYRPLYEALQSALPFETFTANQSAAWRTRVESLGPFKAATPVGTASGGRTTIVRLEFEGGAQYAYFVWGRDGLMGFSIAPTAPRTTFHPRSATEFVSFDLTGRIMRLRAIPDGTGFRVELDLEPPGPIVGAFLAVSVRDLDAAAAWYADTLGLERVMHADEPAGVRMAPLEGNGLLVELIQLPGDVPLATAAPAAKDKEYVHGLFKAGAIVDGFDRLLASVTARGVTIAYGPFPRRGAQRANVIVRDIEGNLLQFFGP